MLTQKRPKALLVRSFTRNPTQGNPAGVLLDCSSLTKEDIVQVAAKLGCSESAFITSSSVADLKVTFSSPTSLVNLCGHGTIAAFHAWISSQPHFFETKAMVSKTMETWMGDVVQVLCYPDGRVEIVQKETKYGSTLFQPAEIAALLQLSPKDIRSDIPIQIVSTGTPKLIIPIQDQNCLQSIHPDLKRIVQFCERHDCYGFYPFYQSNNEFFDFEARQFNPRIGVDEDPITGIAAAALGAYMQTHGWLKKNQIIVRQGYHMNRGGEIFVTLGYPVKIGGYAIIEKEVEV